MRARRNCPTSGAFLNWLPLVPQAMKYPSRLDPVVDRHPVVRCVIHASDARRRQGNAELRQSSSQAQHRDLPSGERESVVELVRVVDPLELVARRLGPADQQGASWLGTEVLADLEVGDEAPPRRAGSLVVPVRRTLLDAADGAALACRR
jgi:hypothetical protein